MENPVKKVGSLPPKKLALIAVGGVGLGLAIRYFNNKRGGGSGGATTPASSDAVDVSQYGLAGSSTGPWAGGTSDAGGSSATGVDDGTSRDVGGSTITLPVLGQVLVIDGKKYWTDGVTLTPLYAPPTGNGVPYPGGNSAVPFPKSDVNPKIGGGSVSGAGQSPYVLGPNGAVIGTDGKMVLKPGYIYGADGTPIWVG